MTIAPVSPVQALPDAVQDAFVPPAPLQHLRSPATRATLRIQQRILAAARELLGAEGFMELLPPTIGAVTDPGGRGAKQVDIDFYGHTYKLMTSGILYKQASLLAFDKIFNVAPNVRMEPLETATTHRHLAEFHQIDVEVAGATRDDVTALAERLVRHVVAACIADMGEELAVLGRDVDALRAIAETDFGRITHREAVERLHVLGHGQSTDAELDWEGEELLSRKSLGAFFVVDYPKGSRGFYDRESTTDPGVLHNFDLILPGGFGEVISGSEREYEYTRLITRMRETGENPAKYRWYLDIAREGLPASAGFGIGLERLTRCVAGLDAVWQACSFPKIPGVVSA
ncbi:asparagine synthetase A [Streptomyces sp. NPDC006544]|uniref:asparagine synthetase A n=1 Tax=Streptomyces sp. NPDC006544 TaxID=3154583 RepID=UPI0033AE7E5D